MHFHYDYISFSRLAHLLMMTIDYEDGTQPISFSFFHFLYYHFLRHNVEGGVLMLVFKERNTACKFRVKYSLTAVQQPHTHPTVNCNDT